jgi:hypothetical protein
MNRRSQLALSLWCVIAGGGCGNWWVDGADLERTVRLTPSEPMVLKYRSQVVMRTEWDFWYIKVLPMGIRSAAHPDEVVPQEQVIDAVATSSIVDPERSLDEGEFREDHAAWAGTGEWDGQWDGVTVAPYRPPGTVNAEDTITLELTLQGRASAEVDLWISAHTAGQGGYLRTRRLEEEVTLEWVE